MTDHPEVARRLQSAAQQFYNELKKTSGRPAEAWPAGTNNS
jgi:hypothetical protein